MEHCSATVKAVLTVWRSQVIPLGMACMALQQVWQHCLWKRHASVKLVDMASALGKPAAAKWRVSAEKKWICGFSADICWHNDMKLMKFNKCKCCCLCVN